MIGISFKIYCAFHLLSLFDSFQFLYAKGKGLGPSTKTRAPKSHTHTHAHTQRLRCVPYNHNALGRGSGHPHFLCSGKGHFGALVSVLWISSKRNETRQVKDLFRFGDVFFHFWDFIVCWFIEFEMVKLKLTTLTIISTILLS